jgi:gamma-glutamylcyclotransferase (GGCT)/AIG2-like uncharacterized protein YtfP
MNKLFVYGTLRDPLIRKKITEREIVSEGKDLLTGFRLSTVSDYGKSYPVIIEDNSSTLEIKGEIIDVTPEELQALDEYEGYLYVRQKVTLKSGVMAWVYVQSK